MPEPELKAITLPASGVVPPIVLAPTEAATSMPVCCAADRAFVPVTSVPIKLPSIALPVGVLVLPAIVKVSSKTPAVPPEEIRLAAPRRGCPDVTPRRAADQVVDGAADQDSGLRVRDRLGAGHVGTDEIAFDDVAGGLRAENGDAALQVARDQVALARGRAADLVQGRIHDDDAVVAGLDGLDRRDHGLGAR